MDYKDYLAHFGTQGMKWGRRNGPPYPLSYRQMSPEQRRLSKKSYAIAGSNNAESNARRRNNLVEDADKKESAKTETPSSVRDLDDDTLNNSINRLRRENDYRSEQGKSVANGASYVKSLLLLTGTTFLSGLAVGVATKGKDKILGLMDKKPTTIKADDIMKTYEGKSDDEVAADAKRWVNVMQIANARNGKKGK